MEVNELIRNYWKRIQYANRRWKKILSKRFNKKRKLFIKSSCEKCRRQKFWQVEEKLKKDKV